MAHCPCRPTTTLVAVPILPHTTDLVAVPCVASYCRIGLNSYTFEQTGIGRSDCLVLLPTYPTTPHFLPCLACLHTLLPACLVFVGDCIILDCLACDLLPVPFTHHHHHHHHCSQCLRFPFPLPARPSHPTPLPLQLPLYFVTHPVVVYLLFPLLLCGGSQPTQFTCLPKFSSVVPYSAMPLCPPSRQDRSDSGLDGGWRQTGRRTRITLPPDLVCWFPIAGIVASSFG